VGGHDFVGSPLHYTVFFLTAQGSVWFNAKREIFTQGMWEEHCAGQDEEGRIRLLMDKLSIVDRLICGNGLKVFPGTELSGNRDAVARAVAEVERFAQARLEWLHPVPEGGGDHVFHGLEVVSADCAGGAGAIQQAVLECARQGGAPLLEAALYMFRHPEFCHSEVLLEAARTNFTPICARLRPPPPMTFPPWSRRCRGGNPSTGRGDARPCRTKCWPSAQPARRSANCCARSCASTCRQGEILRKLVKRWIISFVLVSAVTIAAADPKSPLDEWIAREAIPFAITSGDSFSAATDRLVAALGDKVTLLGFGEALHGGEEILRLRNRLFQRLVEKHGYSAIAIESSFPRGRLVDEYIHGRGPATYEELKDTGFGQGMGQLEANRDLVEWMRAYNLDPHHATKLSFYGFDIPSGTMGIASPRQVLTFVADYLAIADAARAETHRKKIHELLGDDAAWENPAVYMDPSKSIALSPAAASLRIETEDLIAEMRSRRPELVAASGEDAYREALRTAEIARELLNFHAAMGCRTPGQSPAVVLGTRDASMADNLTYIVNREQPRGKVLVFAHNSHLQRGLAVWPGQKYWGTDDDCQWWPAGSHLAGLLGPRYAVIGSAIGVSADNGNR